MKLVWQTNEEWWGTHCIAHHADYKLSIMFMRDAGSCVWRIDEDYRVRDRGTFPGSADLAQDLIARKLRKIKIRDRFNQLFRRSKHVSSAA